MTWILSVVTSLEFNILYYTYHKTESIDSDADIQYEELQQLKQLQLVLKYAVLLSLFLYNYKQTMDHKIKFKSLYR